MPNKPTIALFAGSRMPTDLQLIKDVRKLGTRLGAAGFDVNYGAGQEGLMGVFATAAAQAGAGINAMVLKRYAHETQIPGANMIPVETEQERFTQLSTYHDPVALIMLPGGPGSLREALQGVEGALYDKGPPVILVTNGNYLDGIRDYFTRAVAGGSIKAMYDEKVLSFRAARDVVAHLKKLTA